MVFLAKSKKKSEKPKKAGIAETEETLQRIQAEYENYIKRAEKQCAEAKEQGKAEAVAKMLPLIDSIDASIENLRKTTLVSKEAALEGLEKLGGQATSLMKENGLEHIECVGKAFDSNLQDAMMTGCDEGKEEKTVLEEVQKGYLLNGKVLRHAKVKINKCKE